METEPSEELLTKRRHGESLQLESLNEIKRRNFIKQQNDIQARITANRERARTALSAVKAESDNNVQLN